MKTKKQIGLLGLGVLVLVIPFLWTKAHGGSSTEEVRDVDANIKPCVEEAERKVVSLTFDDGPDGKITPQILKVLKEKGVKATFFCIGEKMEAESVLVREIVKQGHEIGNHTYTHCDLCCVNESQFMDEVVKTGEMILKCTGKPSIWLRPPFGKIRKKDYLSDYILVGWSVDTLDWCSHGQDEILSRVKKQLKEGGIILMHDQYELTLQTLPQMIDWVRSQGYDFVTLNELILGQ